MGSLINKNIIFHPTTGDLKSIREQAQVKDVRVSKNFPHNIQVLITLRTAIGIINNFLVDDSGVVFSPASESTLPRITVDSEIKIGSKIEDKHLSALQTLALFRQVVGSPFTLKSYQGESLVIGLDSGMEIVLNANNTPKGWNDSLQLIFTRSRIDGKVPRKIDLRFNNPIITY